MKIDGTCHCGQIKYEAEIDPKDVGICHCTDCQTLSGSAFRTFALTREGSFKFVAGEPTIYGKTAESGAERLQSFCPNCGTPIYSTTVGEGPKVHSLRAGTIRQRSELSPRFQIWTQSEQDWISNLHSVPKREKQEAVSYGRC